MEPGPVLELGPGVPRLIGQHLGTSEVRLWAPGGVLEMIVPTRGFQADRLSDVLEVFARLEANRAARWDADFLAGSGVAADAAFAGLHLEHAKPAQLDALAALHGGPHRIEYGVDRHLGFDLGDIGDLRHFVHDVDL